MVLQVKKSLFTTNILTSKIKMFPSNIGVFESLAVGETFEF